jgi:hypothetical protein
MDTMGDLIVNGIGAVLPAWWDFFMSATALQAYSAVRLSSSFNLNKTYYRKALDRLKR